MILVDTSAWVEYDRATGSPADTALTSLIKSGDGSLAGTEPVLMEVLAGARSEKSHDDLRRLLTAFGWLAFDPVADLEGAARIYRACRAAGVTPRGLTDCMIANVALRTRSSLLATDRDYGEIARVVPLQLTTI